jgi:hypothetical protein
MAPPTVKTKAVEFMKNIKTAAANLDAEITALKECGFFDTGISIVLAKNNDDEELILNANGTLTHRYYAERITYAQDEKTPFSNTVTSIKVASIFDFDVCIASIHKKIDELLPIAKRNKEKSEARKASRPR